MSYSPDAPNAITVTRLCKSYRNFHQPINRLIQILRPHKTGLYTDFFALRDINFSVARGESLAIIGRNGSGKSTLLQLIYGTLKPSSGQVSTHGKVAALLELGAGFDLEFTGLENLRMTATLYGITEAQLAAKTEEMLAFADIGAFIHQPVKIYSTGMVMRLAFAVIAHVDADILIVDEALAVGDAVFTQKCMRFIRTFKEHGTLLFVSHDMAAVQNLCDRAVWLDDGCIQQIGPAKDVAESYLQYALQQVAGDEVVLQSLPPETETKGWATGVARITDAQLVNLNHPEREFFEGGEKVSMRITVQATQTLARPIIGFLLRDRLGQDLFGENTVRITQEGQETSILAGQSATATFDFTLPLLPNGQYAVACSIADGNLHDNTQHHFIHDALIVTVSSKQARWGLVGIACDQIRLEARHDKSNQTERHHGERPIETLSTLFHRDSGKPAAKWQGYLQHYDRHMAGLKDQPLRILEIGVQAGGSLEVWAQYFKSAALIIGCDIDPACGSLQYDDPRIKVLIGDINTPKTFQSLAALTNTLDIVIDDGSHHSRDVIRSFVQLFPRLTKGGIYLVEDLHCSYWDSYGGGLYNPFSAIAFFKKIIDLINRPEWGVHIEAKDFLAEFREILGETRLENVSSETDWRFLSDIHAIEFVNSMCVIHKREAFHNVLGTLVLSGEQIKDHTDGKPNPSPHQYVVGEMSVPDQNTNIFSKINISKQADTERLSLAHQEISKLKQENIALTTQVYTSTKKFYDASLTIQQLEYQLKQLEQTKPHKDSGTNS